MEQGGRDSPIWNIQGGQYLGDLPEMIHIQQEWIQWD